jgi:hypothetical protein
MTHLLFLSVIFYTMALCADLPLVSNSANSPNFQLLLFLHDCTSPDHDLSRPEEISLLPLFMPDSRQLVSPQHAGNLKRIGLQQ